MKTYAGIDLHSTNNFIGIIDQEDTRLYSKRHENNLKQVLKVLKPYKKNLQGVVIESTYNWYWLVDGLMEHDYKIHLANPAAIQQYSGLKFKDDKQDAFWLAHLLRLGILPEGYIYPKAQRPIRDMLRRRVMFVRQRTSQILSVQSMIARERGLDFSGSSITNFSQEFVTDVLKDPDKISIVWRQIQTIQFLSKQIKEIESDVESRVKLDPAYEMLLTIPGIGKILAMTIMTEIGDIRRFSKVGQYSSYCRCVSARSISNGKRKKDNNRKNGNRYLAWAYVEAANFNKRYCERAREFVNKKTAEKNYSLAIKALSNKLSKASYFIIRNQKEYDPVMLFK